MECNKEEAMRAKEIAESRMLNKDFLGARKIAVKAQQLCPDLENISQMIMVCDVHCSSKNMVCGDEKDWYGILNIDPAADETSIRKQYRKFALSLHPDKNNFAGSTDAFKLISEAQMVLLDRNKRVIYDSKYRASKESCNKSNVCKQTGWFRNHSAKKGYDPKNEQSQQQQDHSMIWTLCPSCCIRYQIRADLVNKSVWCQTCKIYFTGEEVEARTTPRRTYSSSRKPSKDLNSGSFKAKSPTTFRNSASKGVSDRGKRTGASFQTRETPGSHKKFKPFEKSGNMDVKIDKGRRYPQPVRCTQSKMHAYYSKRSSEGPFSKQETPKVKTPDSHVKEDSGLFKGSSQSWNEQKENENGELEATGHGLKSISETYEYPDPDFNNFGQARRECCFQVGQIWAIYDTIDAMPRFYALIKEVLSPGFKLHITWLEPDPDDMEEVKWVCEGFPVSSGRFKYGESEITEDRLMFSHLVHWEKETRGDVHKIYPKKGETWALFKNWDINWGSDQDIKKRYDFEFVEILSDFAEDLGVSVASLGKAKGFTCLFCQTAKGMESFRILPNQLLSFSHRIPSFVMSGEERDNVPKGSFELDPASLPPKLEEVDFCFSEFSTNKMQSVPKSEAVWRSCPLHICPDSDFHNFEKDGSEGCFSVGQVWALYDILDAMPRFYARIDEIYSPVFKLKITWLEPDPDPDEDEEIIWVNAGLPVSCGKFKLGDSETIEDHLMFSHLVLEDNGGVSHTRRIYPRKGETWALFRDWNIKWNSYLEDKRSYGFEFVEVLSDYDKGMGVSVAKLGKVDGFSCLFHRVENEMPSFQVPPNHIFRFSHRVPSFRTNNEELKNVPKGSFELDPGSLPSILK